jgi:hypothetical protein
MCFVVQMECVEQLPLVVVTQRDILNIRGVGGYFQLKDLKRMNHLENTAQRKR